MNRVKTSLDHKRIRRLIWLVLTFFVLLGYSLQSAAGSAHYSMLMEPNTTVTSPPVILEEGNCSGTTTIYTNKTSAKVNVTAPLFDYVDNNDSDVDSSPDKGTHSNFTAQQFGPDLINDTLTEAEGSDETTYDYSSGAGSNKWAYKGETSSPPAEGPDVTGQTEVTNYTLIESSNDVRDSFGPTSPGTRPYFNFKFTITETSITQLYLLFEGYPLAAGATVYLRLWNFTGSVWDTKNSTVATGGQDQNFTATVTTGITDYINASDYLYFLVQDGTNKGTVYCDYVKVVVTYSVANYELDLEVQWTNVDYDEANEELCIYGGTMGSENITVDVWNGSAWKNLFTDLSSGWNNVSVSSYLTSSNFTIRFKGGNETGDTAQDSWNIDATLLHLWTDSSTYDYVLQVVNQGASNRTINLQVYDNSSIARLSSTTISFHDGSSSDQIIVSDGAITQSEGPSYNLAGNATIYISMSNVKASASGTSRLYVYLKILVPNTTTYSLYVIIFEII